MDRKVTSRTKGLNSTKMDQRGKTPDRQKKNPTGGMDVSLLWVLCAVRQRSVRRAGPSSRVVLPSMVCLKSVIVKPRKMRRPRPPRSCRAIGKKIIIILANCVACTECAEISILTIHFFSMTVDVTLTFLWMKVCLVSGEITFYMKFNITIFHVLVVRWHWIPWYFGFKCAYCTSRGFQTSMEYWWCLNE
jgi:hypothetical protein